MERHIHLVNTKQCSVQIKNTEFQSKYMLHQRRIPSVCRDTNAYCFTLLTNFTLFMSERSTIERHNSSNYECKQAL